MKVISSKIPRFIIYFLIILLLISVIYLIYPKYQVQMVRLSDDTIIVTKINTLTGQTKTYNPFPKPIGRIDIRKELGLEP